MNSCRPFFTPGDAADPTYAFTRDNEHWEHERQTIEAQWNRFHHLCGDDEAHFLADARMHPQQRLWEIRLACILLDHGHRLEAPPKDAPDILCRLASGTAWIEATVPGRGDGADAVDPPREGFTFINRDKMMLRYTSALRAKLTQFGEFRKRAVGGKRIIEDDHAYVVAINSSSIPNSDIEDGIPDIVRTVFGAGRQQFIAPVLGATGPVTSRWPWQLEVAKQSGSTVPTGAFLHDGAADISAVLFSAASPWSMRDNDHKRVIVVHNPFARVPLPRGTFAFGREWWHDREAGKLHCKPWNAPKDERP